MTSFLLENCHKLLFSTHVTVYFKASFASIVLNPKNVIHELYFMRIFFSYRIHSLDFYHKDKFETQILNSQSQSHPYTSLPHHTATADALKPCWSLASTLSSSLGSIHKVCSQDFGIFLPLPVYELAADLYCKIHTTSLTSYIFLDSPPMRTYFMDAPLDHPREKKEEIYLRDSLHYSMLHLLKTRLPSGTDCPSGNQQ